MIAKFSAIQCDDRWDERFRKISNIKTIKILWRNQKIRERNFND